ncbi:4'-phosphopantetheinyl transferase superfamily protein [Streptomyces sp. NPDC001657]|uniref:4'-phosphopantetheinyl transferase family protein n=1 Tax=Streptomyces sp. NPDC001657 TaxID=3154522 RepID=UPI00332F26E4
MAEAPVCRVWWSPAVDDPAARALLDADERARRERLHQAADRARLTTGRALIRTVIGRLTGTPPRRVALHRRCRHCGGPHGKPFVPGAGVRFSLAHAGDRVVLAVTEGPEPGVDVERVPGRSVRRLAPRVLAEDEYRAFQALPEHRRNVAYAVYWTRKEALLKAVGLGIVVPKRDITVSGPGRSAALVAWRGPYAAGPFALFDLAPGPGYAGALAVHGRSARVEERFLAHPLDDDGREAVGRAPAASLATPGFSRPSTHLYGKESDGTS